LAPGAAAGGPRLESAVKDLLAQLLQDEERDFLPETELEERLEDQDQDWDIRGFDD
jgi:hypothetical protein